MNDKQIIALASRINFVLDGHYLTRYELERVLLEMEGISNSMSNASINELIRLIEHMRYLILDCKNKLADDSAFDAGHNLVRELRDSVI